MSTEKDRQRNMGRALDAAVHCYGEYGVEKTTQVMIAAKAGLSVKSIKRYFNTREELLYQVSERILNYWYQEIEKKIKEEKPEEMNGLEALKCFLNIHDDVLLKDYKLLVFIQDADFYCRHHVKKTDDYWKQFRKTDILGNAVKEYLAAGVKDGSIKENMDIVFGGRAITSACAGLVEHLASEVQFGLLTYEEALKIAMGSNHRLDDLIGKKG